VFGIISQRGFESPLLRQINELRLLNLTLTYLKLPKNKIFTVPNVCHCARFVPIRVKILRVIFGKLIAVLVVFILTLSET
jgi:hypothetical protein